MGPASHRISTIGAFATGVAFFLGVNTGSRSGCQYGKPPIGGKTGLTLDGKAITATLVDNETTRDFVSLLPLTLTMGDLFGREKFGELPRPILKGGKRTRTYEVGDVIYWSPSAHLAIYYRDDGQPIPRPASSSWAGSIPARRR